MMFFVSLLYYAFLFYTIWFISRQNIGSNARLLWALVAIFVPLGMFLPYFVFRKPTVVKEKTKPIEYVVGQATKIKRKNSDITLEDLLNEDVEEKRKFH